MVIYAALVLPFAVLFSALYSYFIWFIPFPYFNFIGTLIAGFLVGYIFPIKTSKCTNSTVALVSVVLFALLCHYIGWAVWLDLYINQGEIIEINHPRSPISAFVPSSSNLDQIITLFTDPSLLFSFLTDLGEYGYFTIFSVTPSGFGLYLIWLVELIMFVGAAAVAAFQKSNEPFNPERNEWLKSTKIRLSYISDENSLFSALRSQNASFFEELAPTGKEESHAEVEIWHLDNEQAYISIKNKMMKINDNGKTDSDDTELIQYASISNKTLSILLAKAT